ncbi:hypothetical protein H310_07135 [Aphanomyces invadans]|uniref:Methylated-DNA--protein-cysteine methyltransferase n=1 Tax=Aphanomyces invadans TaxID=157072 RepID=A0A024U2S6_9STRA|nr:hypothetical protein H310_07135 [Aphanomyces invadans]ETW00549.1 hypothetical protein H310_07135 [Aphanomyces invadans]|eukprot:XP_008870684.1 hypothetical protein H310_07135 [Aphanomyces invadans]
MPTKKSSMKKAAGAAKKVTWRGMPVTEHDIKVYKLISRIPAGKVATYGAVAKAIHSGPRGVGQALRRNPFAPQVPCHRVVSATRSLHGFRGFQAVGSTDPACNDLNDKRTLLAQEGVKFSDDKVDLSCMYQFTDDDVHAVESLSP